MDNKGKFKTNPESLSFNVSQFSYKIEYLNDNITKDKSILIEAEHFETKRIWKILIEKDGLSASSHGGQNEIMLGPETIYKAFKLALDSNHNYCDIENKINVGSFSIEFPTTGKDETSPLIIIIDIENQFAELYQQCPITLDPIKMTNEELHQKQIDHLRQVVFKLENEIKNLKQKDHKLQENEDTGKNLSDFVTREEFEELKNKIKNVLRNKVSTNQFEKFSQETVSQETFYSTLEKKVSYDDLKKAVENKISKNEFEGRITKMVSRDDFDLEISVIKSEMK